MLILKEDRKEPRKVAKATSPRKRAAQIDPEETALDQDVTQENGDKAAFEPEDAELQELLSKPLPEPERTPRTPPTEEETWKRDSLKRFRKMLPGEDFWLWKSRFLPEDWPSLIVYVWRTAPIIDLSRGQKALSIGKYARDFDMEDIKKEYGSGAYRLDFCMTDPGTKESKRLASYYFEINDLKFPPRIAWGPWVKYPANENWIWAHRDNPNIFADEIREISGQTNAPTSQQSPSQASAQTVELQQMNLSLLKEIQSQNDPEKALRMIRELRQMEKENAPPPAPAPVHTIDPATNMMFEMMREQLREARAELRDMRASLASKPPVDPWEQVLQNIPKLNQVIETLGFKPTRAMPSSKEPGWASVAMQAIEKFSGPFGAFMDAAQQARQQGAPPNGAQQQQPPIVNNNPAAIGEVPQQMDQEIPMDPKTAQAMEDYKAILGQSAPFMMDMFAHGDDNAGLFFREWFISRFTIEKWQDMKNRIPADALAQGASTHPFLKPIMQPYPRVLRFFELALSDLPIPDEPDQAETNNGASAA